MNGRWARSVALLLLLGTLLVVLIALAGLTLGQLAKWMW